MSLLLEQTRFRNDGEPIKPVPEAPAQPNVLTYFANARWMHGYPAEEVAAFIPAILGIAGSVPEQHLRHLMIWAAELHERQGVQL